MSDFNRLTVMQMRGVINQLPDPESWMERNKTYTPPPFKVMLFDCDSGLIGGSLPFNTAISEYNFKVVDCGTYYDWELIL